MKPTARGQYCAPIQESYYLTRRATRVRRFTQRADPSLLAPAVLHCPDANALLLTAQHTSYASADGLYRWGVSLPAVNGSWSSWHYGLKCWRKKVIDVTIAALVTSRRQKELRTIQEALGVTIFPYLKHDRQLLHTRWCSITGTSRK